MINCICVDTDKKSRDSIEKLIRKTGKLRLVKTFAALDAAASVCKGNNIHLLFVRLSRSPVQKKDINLLNRIMKNGTRVIVMSSTIPIAREILAFNITNFINLPTSSRHLWKTSMQALQIIDHGIDIPNRNREEQPDDAINLLNH